MAKMEPEHLGNERGLGNKENSSLVQTLKTTLTTKEGLLGDYDYAALFTPRIPCLPRFRTSKSLFYGLNERIPVLVAIIMGFQHFLAAAGGVIAVPRILAGGGPNHLQLEPEVQAYLISNALLVTGFMSIIQIIRFRLVKGYYLGTGLIQISGTSFTFLPIAEAAFLQMRSDGTCPAEGPCPTAYGRWLGTLLVAAFVEIGLSFVRPSVIRKIFPPIVTGVTILAIGASLIGSGLRAWAGGNGPCINMPEDSFFSLCPNILASQAFPWGHRHWIGLGFFVFALIILIEIFGSPFMRNSGIIISLISGIILAAALGYLDTNLINSAPWITFAWVETFPLGFYGPALLPAMLGFMVSTIETVGDIAASAEASRVETEGEEFESRIQGGLLADGVNSFIAALMTSNPTTTFSQNNGVIVLTGTANKWAGFAACVWFIFFGMIGRLGSLFVAVPDAVLGGLTTFLFANVAVTGIRILATLAWDRRDRFILAVSLSLALGVSLVPNAFKFFIPSSTNTVLNSFRDGVVIILTTGYSIGALTSMILNFIIPRESDEIDGEPVDLKE